MKRGMRRISHVLFGKHGKHNVAKLSCGHLVPTHSSSVFKIGRGFLLCASCVKVGRGPSSDGGIAEVGALHDAEGNTTSTYLLSILDGAARVGSSTQKQTA